MNIRLTEQQICRYSAAMTAPCGVGILVWRNYEHPHQDQMKDHLAECNECQKIIKEYILSKTFPENISSFVQHYIQNYIKEYVYDPSVGDY